MAHRHFFISYLYSKGFQNFPLILCPLFLSWMHVWWCFNEVLRVCIRIHLSGLGWLAPVDKIISDNLQLIIEYII